MGSQKYDFARMNGCYYADPIDLRIIGIDTPHDHRGSDPGGHALFDSRVKYPLDAAMVANVEEFGILEVVTIAKLDGLPTVWKGRTRVRWCRAANLLRAAKGLDPHLVPVREVVLDDERMWDQGRSENAVRVATDALTVAADMAAMKAAGKTIAAIARIHGISESKVHAQIALLGLAKPIKDAIATGEVSVTTAARVFLPLEHNDQIERLTQLREVSGGGKITQDTARTGVRSSAAPGCLSLAQIRKLCESEHLSADVRAVLKAVTGTGPASRISGLTQALRDIGFKG